MERILIFLQASDIYGEATGEVPIVVTLEQKSEVISDGGGISSSSLVFWHSELWRWSRLQLS